MLDTKAGWDELIRRHAPDAQPPQMAPANPPYRNITGRFVNSHDYLAMERLYDVHASGEYDLVVIDTPPSRNVLDLLDAPGRMRESFGSRLLKWLTVPYRSRLFTMASKPFYQVADRILGSGFLQDIAEFFVLFQTMEEGSWPVPVRWSACSPTTPPPSSSSARWSSARLVEPLPRRGAAAAAHAAGRGRCSTAPCRPRCASRRRRRRPSCRPTRSWVASAACSPSWPRQRDAPPATCSTCSPRWPPASATLRSWPVAVAERRRELEAVAPAVCGGAHDGVRRARPAGSAGDRRAPAGHRKALTHTATWHTQGSWPRLGSSHASTPISTATRSITCSD